MTYELLVDYWFHNFTDSQIAKDEKVSRTAICHRRRYHKIPNRIMTGRIGELKAIQLFKGFGFDVIDMNLVDKTASYDLLIDGHIRIDVKSASLSSDKKYNFQLTNKLSDGCKHRRLSTRTKKDYEKSCDFILFVCIDDDNYYLQESAELNESIITQSIGRSTVKYLENKIKSRQDILTAISKLDTSIVAQASAVEKGEHMRTEEIVFENERKVINLIRGAIKTRGLSATYSVNNQEKMDVRIGYTLGIKNYVVDLTDSHSIEQFQIDVQEKIKVEDLL